MTPPPRVVPQWSACRASVAILYGDLCMSYSDEMQHAVPLGEAFQLRDNVLSVFGDPTVTLDEKGAAALQQIITKTGALDRVERMIYERRIWAFAVLEQIQIPGRAKEALRELAGAATVRTS